MKKKLKKLVLAKETVADLGSGIVNVAGANTVSCTGCGPPACPWSGYHTCVTCGATCGTNLC